MEKETILLVEDDAPVRGLMRDALSSEYDVIEAACYSEAMTHLKNPFSIALVDYVLPDGDGLELIKTMRRHKPMTPIIFMTAYDHKTAALNAARAGATTYLSKPISLKLLSSKVSSVLQGQMEHTEDKETRQPDSRKEFVMDGIKAYIENNFMKNVTLDRLAEIAGMSRFNLCRTFKKRFGQSCMSHVNSVRIKNAEELLRNRDLNVTEIALFVGFSSVEYFDRVFRSVHGMSPREYRKKIVADEAG